MTVNKLLTADRRSRCAKCEKAYDRHVNTMCPRCSKAEDFPHQSFVGEGIIGIRIFRIDGRNSDAGLYGGYAISWPTPYLEATCYQSSFHYPAEGDAPHLTHRCGINAYRPDSLDHPTCDFLETAALRVSYRVIGICQLWGNVIEHEDGIRASHCKVLAIVSFPKFYDDPSMEQVIVNYPAWGSVDLHQSPLFPFMIPVGESTKKLVQYIQELSLQYSTPLVEQES